MWENFDCFLDKYFKEMEFEDFTCLPLSIEDVAANFFLDYPVPENLMQEKHKEFKKKLRDCNEKNKNLCTIPLEGKERIVRNSLIRISVEESSDGTSPFIKPGQIYKFKNNGTDETSAGGNSTLISANQNGNETFKIPVSKGDYIPYEKTDNKSEDISDQEAIECTREVFFKDGSSYLLLSATHQIINTLANDLIKLKLIFIELNSKESSKLNNCDYKYSFLTGFENSYGPAINVIEYTSSDTQAKYIMKTTNKLIDQIYMSYIFTLGEEDVRSMKIFKYPLNRGDKYKRYFLKGREMELLLKADSKILSEIKTSNIDNVTRYDQSRFFINKVLDVNSVVLVDPIFMMKLLRHMNLLEEDAEIPEVSNTSENSNEDEASNTSDIRRSRTLDVLKNNPKLLGVYAELSVEELVSLGINPYKTKDIYPGKLIFICPENIREVYGGTLRESLNQEKPDSFREMYKSKQLEKNPEQNPEQNPELLLDALYKLVLYHEFGHAVFKSYVEKESTNEVSSEKDKNNEESLKEIVKKAVESSVIPTDTELLSNVYMNTDNDELKADIFAWSQMSLMEKNLISLYAGDLLENSHYELLDYNVFSRSYGLVDLLVIEGMVNEYEYIKKQSEE